jgi:hypothetical protein
MHSHIAGMRMMKLNVSGRSSINAQLIAGHIAKALQLCEEHVGSCHQIRDLLTTRVVAENESMLTVAADF